MQVIRVSAMKQSFYARLMGDSVLCLDRSKGLDAPIPLSQVVILPLAVPSKIVCLAAGAAGGGPGLFLKPPTAVIGPGGTIVVPREAGRVDYAGGLAVVVGRTCRNLRPEDAPAHIFGYTCAADVTARDLLEHDGLPARAKGFDTFAPVGPWIETDVEDPTALAVSVLVGGHAVAQASTADLPADPWTALSLVSRVMTLLPGDVVFAGAPGAPVPIAPGDEVAVEIAGLGRLINSVAGAPDDAAPDEGAAPLQ